MDKMTIEKAREIISNERIYRNVNCNDSHCTLVQRYGEAKGFIDGYESRDAEVSGLKNELDSLQRRFRKNSGEEYLRA